MKKLIVGVGIILLVGIPVAWWLLHNGEFGQSLETRVSVQPATDSLVTITPRKHASVGWSIADTETEAVRQAVDMAEKRLGDKKANFAFVAVTMGYSIEKIREELDRRFSPNVKIHGLTSGRAVMTQDGYHIGNVGSLGILLVSDESSIRFGVGAVDGNASPEDLEAQGQEAIRKAIADAGMPDTRQPDVVLYGGVMHRGGEMRILDGIAKVIGPNTPVLGGNAGQDMKHNPGAPFTRQKVYPQGLVLTAVYTDRTIGWSFEYGFRQTETTGKITKANAAGNVIQEIDGRPALDVYDEWLNGKLLPVVESKSLQEIAGFTACNPISRIIRGTKGQSGFIVAEAIPLRENLKDRSLPVFANIPEGSTIRLLAGRWQNLVNRSEQIASMALLRGGNRADNIEFGLLNFCWAASLAVPPSELPKIPLLIRNQIPQTPFLGMFTKGETGLLPGIRNVFCNLAASVVLVEQEKNTKVLKEN